MDFNGFYSNYGGVKEFSRRTASPAYGMLNSGLQMYWLKNKKLYFWKQVHSILHYQQYLSYLFSKKITADFTSIGAHTAIWDFDKMKYHFWLGEEGISLPNPVNGKEAVMVNLNGDMIAIGSGLHDSSASLIPLLEENQKEEFILLSTGTWIISMNPFSKEQLTQAQLENNCLCFMTTDKKQVKSSMQFLGHVHEINVLEFSSFYGKKKDYYFGMTLNKDTCFQTFQNSEKVFFPNGIPNDYKADLSQLKSFSSFEAAYDQLVFEISQLVYDGLKFILDKDHKLKNIFISGGFNKNLIFMQYLSLMLPDLNIEASEMKNTSALGAALLMNDYLSKK
jgi:sugar (pentulose or hexulose) kinase